MTTRMNNPIRLVIVDDHEMIRHTWRMILQKHDRVQVVADCASGAEAIDCAKKESPDIVPMDINIIPMNGLTQHARSSSFTLIYK